MPTGLKVASPLQEVLDMRPQIAGSYTDLKSIHILAHIPSTTIKRIKNTDYPDFNLLYIPLRHLIFQGEVEDPTRSKSSLSFEMFKKGVGVQEYQSYVLGPHGIAGSISPHIGKVELNLE